MKPKKIGKALLFPHAAVIIALLPVSAVLLIGSMVFVGTDAPIAYASYVIAFYTLTVISVRIPDIVKFCKAFGRENRLIERWRTDARLRVNLSLYGTLFYNVLYGVFQLWLGFYHRTFWYYSLGAYYLTLSAMRYFLVRYTGRYSAGEKMKTELLKYRACGWVFLLMNTALSLIVFFMIYWNRSFNHHEITAIAMAAYTFTAFTLAIIGVVRYRKYKSPAYSATKAISLAAAIVSVLTLTSTLLTTFDDGGMGELGRKIMLGSVGFAVSGAVVAMAVYMIVLATKKLKELKTEVDNER